ncbi:DNA internalization-related competence protein ComEC/Rec2 [Vallitalea sediminicola]
MKRPAVSICIFYLTGLLVGYYIRNILLVILLFSITIILAGILYKTYLWKGVLIFPLICFFAYINICNHIELSNNTIDKIFDGTVSCLVEGHIDDIASNGEKTQFIISANKIIIDDETYSEGVNIKVYGTDITDLEVGDYVTVNGKLNKLSRPTNQGQFDEEKYYRIRGIKYKLFLKDYQIMDNNKMSILTLFKYSMKKKFAYIKNESIKVYDRILPEDQASLMKAMILGEKSYLSVDTKNKYSESGISHVLAISGLHIAILGYGFFGFICLVFSKKKGVIITICFLVLYLILTGASVSTIRAVIMLSIILLAYFFGRTYDIYSAIATAAIIILVINPYNLWDIGFLLSFTAVIGIITITPALDELYNKNSNKVLAIFNVSLAATLGTMPVMIINFYELHIYSVLVNILVVPLMSIVVLFGFIGLIFGSVSIYFGKLISGIIFYILNFYDLCCESANSLPLSTIIIGKPNLINIVLFVTILVLISMFAYEKIDKQIIKKLIAIAASALLVMNLVFYIREKPLEIVHLDIGQGDSAVVISPDRKVYIIDGGGNLKKKTTDRDTGYYILRPYLKYNGISKIDCLIMTHSDRDHVGGLIELVDYFKIDNILLPYAYKNKGEKDILLEELISRANEKKINIVYINEKDVIKDKYITFETLYPLKDTTTFHNNNAYSLVLKLKYKSFDELFTGDIEKEEEEKINNKYTDYLNSDIIKVPHHGSNSSSTKEFVEYVKPRLAVISSGRNNRFGHPHKEIVERYMKNDIPIFNTSTDGAITIKTDGYNMGINTYYSDKQIFLGVK